MATTVTETNERIESRNTNHQEEAKMSDTGYRITVTYEVSDSGYCWAVLDVEDAPKGLGASVLPRERSMHQTPPTRTWEAARLAVAEAIEFARTEINRRRELFREKPDEETYII